MYPRFVIIIAAAVLALTQFGAASDLVADVADSKAFSALLESAGKSGELIVAALYKGTVAVRDCIPNRRIVRTL